jgi:hypothetical protein
MENINAVREAIEDLNTDEKINEGLYLELMNHLKTLYGKMERHNVVAPPQPPPLVAPALPADYPFPEYRSVIRGTPEENIEAVQIHKKYFTNSPMAVSEMFGFDSLAFLRAFDEFLANTDESLENAKKVALTAFFHNANLNHQLGRCLLIFLAKYSSNWSGDWGFWRRVEDREKFLSHFAVRRLNIILAEYQKSNMKKLLAIVKDETNDDEWAKLFWTMGFPFFNHKYYKRNKCQERTEAERKKLHIVKMKFKMNAELSVSMSLFTDKIQLGRSPIVPDMYKMALLLALQDDINAPIERFIRRMRSSSGYLTTPVLITSGITAKTRDKSRSYKQYDGDFTISYTSKLNDVENDDDTEAEEE